MARVPSTTPPEGAEIPPRHPEAPAPGALLPSHYKHCYGCGELSPAGLHLVAHAGEGASISAEFTVTEDHQGAPGLAHGGLISLAFDEALGKLMWLLRAPAVTARLETDFLLPVPVGSVLHISAHITGQVNRKVYTSAEGRLNTPDGPLAVKASALYIIVKMEHFFKNAPKEYVEFINQNPHLLSIVAADFEINP